MFEVVAATTTDETFVTHVTHNLTLSIESNSQHQQQHSISAGSVKISQFPCRMVNIWGKCRLCQIVRYMPLSSCLLRGRTQWSRSVVNALFSRFETILILYIRRLRT